MGCTQSILISSVMWHAGQEVGAMWVTISACPCTVLPGFPLTPGWVNPQAQVPQVCTCSDTSHLFPRVCPQPCPQHSSRQQASAGAPHPLQPPLLNPPQAALTGDGLVHDGLFLWAAQGHTWPALTQAALQPPLSKTASYAQYRDVSSVPPLKGTVATCLQCCNSVAFVSTKIQNERCGNKDASCFNH